MGAAATSEQASSDEDGLPRGPGDRDITHHCLGALNDDSDASTIYDWDDNPCCGFGSQNSNLSQIKQLISFMAPIFTSPDIRNVMRAIIRDHFVYNTGAVITSLHYNKGEVPTPDNGNHVCFAPRREVQIISTVVEILETLKLKQGHSFLHLGSGTGYINTLAGVLIGGSGVNHGVEVNPEMLAYAEERQKALRDHCQSLENFEYCEPTFVLGDCLKLDPTPCYYDRILCSGILPEGYETFLGNFLKRDGLLLFPQNTGHHVIVRRKGEGRIIRETIEAFSSLRVYPFVTDESDDSDTKIKLPEQNFPSLQQLSRAAIRTHIRMVTVAEKSRKRKAELEKVKEVYKKFKSSNTEEDKTDFPQDHRAISPICLALQHEKPEQIENPQSPIGEEEKSLPSSPEAENRRIIVVEYNTFPQSPEVEQNNIEVKIHKVMQGNDLTQNKETDIQENISLSSNDSKDSYKDETLNEENIINVSKLFDENSDAKSENSDYAHPLKTSSCASSSDDSESVSTVYSNDSDMLIAPEHQFCIDCHVFKSRSVPKPVCPYNPNKSYPADTLYGKIKTLPLPDNIILYLKYKHDLIN